MVLSSHWMCSRCRRKSAAVHADRPVTNVCHAASQTGFDWLCLSCRYVVQCMLGQGTFGQVVECVREDHGHERLAVKVIKNQQAYFQQVPHC